MRFCIRSDDHGLTPREAAKVPDKLSDKGCEIAKRFHEAMQGVPYLAAVVPAALDEAGGAWIRSKPKGMTVALHGWDHSMRGDVKDEFHGYTVERMREEIARGQKVVGLTQHFVPPFNAVEDGLAEACYHEGIRYIWGAPSRWPTPPQPYQIYRDLVFVPSWNPMYGATRWEQGNQPRVLTMLRYGILDLPGLAVLTLHGPTWEAAKDPEFNGVKELVSIIRNHVVTPEEFLEEARRA